MKFNNRIVVMGILSSIFLAILVSPVILSSNSLFFSDDNHLPNVCETYMSDKPDLIIWSSVGAGYIGDNIYENSGSVVSQVSGPFLSGWIFDVFLLELQNDGTDMMNYTIENSLITGNILSKSFLYYIDGGNNLATQSIPGGPDWGRYLRKSPSSTFIILFVRSFPFSSYTIEVCEIYNTSFRGCS